LISKIGAGIELKLATVILWRGGFETEKINAG